MSSAVERSEIRYARTGDHHIAYRVLVADPPGEHDIVMLTAANFPMDSLPDDPLANRLLDGLASLGRLIVFDRRGIGLSDGITDWDASIPEQWADDLAAVIDAAGCARPTIFSWHPLGIERTYSIRSPDRVANLVLLNPIALEALDAEWVSSYAEITKRMRSGEDRNLHLLNFPNRWSDPLFRSWFDAAGRAGASPGVAERLSHEMVFEPVDNTRVLTPTLVICRPSPSGHVPPDATAMVARQLPHATYVELPPGDFMAVGAGVDDLLAEISRYLTGSARVPAPDRLLTAILFTDMVESTHRAEAAGDAEWKRLLDRHDEISRTVVGRGGGEVVKMTGDGVLAILPSATAALNAAVEIRARLEQEDLGVRIGVHVGEIDRRGNDVSGLAVNVAARIMAEAGPGQILVTEMVTKTTSAAEYVPLGSKNLKGVDGSWKVFSVIESTEW